jgi:hypothetical protein
MTPSSCRYWAFISYSSQDEAAAQRFHRALERFRLPRALVGRPSADGTPLPRWLFPIFRDREELPLSADLGEAITGALRASRYLIVLCSPAAANSRWVNEEVRYFKSIGGEGRILAIILAGRPNADDHGVSSDEECFPPALRYRVGADGTLSGQRCEPIGGDLRPGGDGWTACLLKAVAGITGLDLATLTRRESQLRRRRRVLWGVAALLGVALAIGWWDHNRTKVKFHTSLTERFGEPEGVTKTALAEVLRGASFYRVESERGKVRRVIRMNGSGFPVADENSPLRAAIRKYSYREDGLLQGVELRGPDGHLLAQQSFSEVSASPEAKIIDVQLKGGPQRRPLGIDAWRGLTAPRSRISVLRYVFGADGLPRQKINYDSDHEVVFDQTGSAGEFWQHDERGLMRETIFLGSDLRPRPRQDGVQSIRYERDAAGRVVGTTYHGVDGEPVAGPEGIHRIETVYDAAGNKALEAYRDAAGDLATRVGGYAVVRMVRDKRGNVVEEAYFSANRKLAPILPGIAIERRKFDERGNATEVVFFGPGPEPVRTPHGYDTVRYTYDAANRRTRTAYFADGQPVSSGEGFAAMEVIYDRAGHLVRVAFFDAAGVPVVGGEGYAEMRVSYDKRGHQTGAAYFGPDGRPILLPEGHAAESFGYDRFGNIVEITRLGVDGRPVPGAAILRLERDERGNIKEESSLDGHGRLALENGYAVVRRKFDSLGNKTEEAFFGVGNEPVLSTDGYAAAKFTYDARARVTREAYFGVDGRPVLHRNGYAVLERSFDAQGQPMETGYDTSGRPVAP